jgi:hypothetical protein
MTIEQIREFLQGFRAKHSFVEVTQTAEQVAQMLGYWHPPFNFVVDDQNLLDLFERCLFSHHIIQPMWLDTTCRESRDHLRWHQAPTVAPAPTPEPEPPQPKLTGSDSLGFGATSTEKPISSVVEDAPTESKSTALERGRDYAYGRPNYANQLEALRQQAWKETPLVNGLPDHAKINQRYAELKDALDKTINTPKKNDSLMKVRDAAFAEARSAGVTTYNELMRRIDAAVEAAKGK